MPVEQRPVGQHQLDVPARGSLHYQLDAPASGSLNWHVGGKRRGTKPATHSLARRADTVTTTASIFLAVTITILNTHLVAAQEPKSKEQSALVDGLLDLLNEPANNSNQQPIKTATPTPGKPKSTHQELEGHSSNPLQGVRQSMQIAAGYLSKGVVNQQTRELQSDIVLRLDDLIEQLQQANEQSQQQQQQQEQQQSQQMTQSQQQQQSTTQSPSSPQQSPTTNPNGNDNERQPGQADTAPDSPAQKGEAANPNVNLVDPKVLQQNVWGQLPEQVRKQMQSRMVEEFLPSYRQQIEAYFQALLESDLKN